MIGQKCHEWDIQIRIAAIDFTKTFDSITRKSIWKALKSYDINHEYIRLLKKIYKDQKASVQTDREQHVRDQERNQRLTLFLAYFSTQFYRIHWKTSPALTGEKSNDNLSERSRSRLSHKSEVRRRRTNVRNLQRIASKNIVRSQGKYRKSGSQDSSSKNERSQ